METHYEKLNKKLDKLHGKLNTPEQKTNRRQQTTYPRTINLTKIQFTPEEQKLLDLGLQYSLQKPSAASWTNLVIETEHAIGLLDDKLQGPFHIMADKRQLHIVKQINQKITKGNAMVTKADKGKSTVIIYTQDYKDKVHTFLAENNFHPFPIDPTTKDHKAIQKALQCCDSIIDKKHIKYLTQKSPTPLTLNALLKLHKPNIPIRPVVNNKNPPGHKAAKKLNTILNNCLHLDYQYNNH
jgi:hypothetical protein